MRFSQNHYNKIYKYEIRQIAVARLCWVVDLFALLMVYWDDSQLSQILVN